jgi:hypothetical protein
VQRTATAHHAFAITRGLDIRSDSMHETMRNPVYLQDREQLGRSGLRIAEREQHVVVLSSENFVASLNNHRVSRVVQPPTCVIRVGRRLL